MREKFNLEKARSTYPYFEAMLKALLDSPEYVEEFGKSCGFPEAKNIADMLNSNHIPKDKEEDVSRFMTAFSNDVMWNAYAPLLVQLVGGEEQMGEKLKHMRITLIKEEES